MQVSNNSGKNNIINLKYTIFEAATVTALLISGNNRSSHQGETGTDKAWYERKDSNNTAAWKSRIEGTEEKYQGRV